MKSQISVSNSSSSWVTQTLRWWIMKNNFVNFMENKISQSHITRIPLYDRLLCNQMTGVLFVLAPLIQFRRRTFHELNLILWIKYMKSLASESGENSYLNLEQLGRSFCLAQLGISHLEWLDLDVEPFMRGT